MTFAFAHGTTTTFLPRLFVKYRSLYSLPFHFHFQWVSAWESKESVQRRKRGAIKSDSWLLLLLRQLQLLTTVTLLLCLMFNCAKGHTNLNSGYFCCRWCYSDASDAYQGSSSGGGLLNEWSEWSEWVSAQVEWTTMFNLILVIYRADLALCARVKVERASLSVLIVSAAAVCCCNWLSPLNEQQYTTLVACCHLTQLVEPVSLCELWNCRS